VKKSDKKHLTTGKSGYIFYQRRYKGTQNKETRYYFSLRTKDWNEAMKLRDQYNYELQKFGTILIESEEQTNVVPVFGQLCTEWYEDKKVDPDVREDTLVNYRGMLNAQFLKAPFVNKPIDKIKRFEFEDWWKKHLTKTCNSGTIRYHLTTLGNIFNYAVGRYIDFNPVKGVKKPKKDDDEIHPLNKHEVDILLEKATEQEEYFKKNMESVYDYLVVKIWTGLRISEINALETRKHIDLKHDKIKVRQSIVDGKIGLPKTKSSKREVDMCPMVREAVKRQMKRSIKKGAKFLFHNSHGNAVRRHNFSAYVWRPLMKMLDIPYRTFEQTRHSFASILLARGERPYYISKQMGHANLYVTLSRYAKFIPSEDDGQILSKVT
jgi:integrase